MHSESASGRNLHLSFDLSKASRKNSEKKTSLIVYPVTQIGIIDGYEKRALCKKWPCVSVCLFC